MAIDASIPLQTTGGSGPPLGTLSSLLNIRNQQAQLQGIQQQNQQGAIDLKERQGVQGILANIANYRDANGNINFTTLTPDIMAVAPTSGAQVLGNIATTQNAVTTAKTAVMNMSQKAREISSGVLAAASKQDPSVGIGMVNALSQQIPETAPFNDYAVKYHLAPNAGDTEAYEQHLKMLSRAVMSPTAQQSSNTPEGLVVNDGATTKMISTKPGTDVPVGQVVPGTQATLQLPPTAQTIAPDGTTSAIGPHASVAPIDTSGVQGPQRGAILADIARTNPDASVRAQAQQVAQGGVQQFPNAVPTSLPAGQAQNIANNVDEMNRHFSGLQDQSTGNQLVAGLTGNIKALADRAATGTGGGYKALASGLMQAFHIPSTGDEKTDTDLLEKNMAQLNLGTPASSDAARALVSAARPHSSMSAQAIKDAADQVASQVQANMAMRNMLAPAKMMGDPATYQAQRQKLEGIADPRAWQYVNLGPGSQAAKDFMGKLQPADRAALIQKVDQLEQMGMLK